MDDKTNLYVFEKKEIALIFFFMLVIAIISFLLGVKVGGSFSYESVGLEQSDMRETNNIELKSIEEEKVNDLINAPKTEVNENGDKKELNQEIQDSLKKKMEQEFSEENKKYIKNKEAPEKEANNSEKTKKASIESVPVSEESEEGPSKNSKDGGVKSDGLAGKYSIQVGSYQSLSEAEEFAEPFKILGYSPIVSEDEVPNMGNWFRVSIGVFSSVNEAKEYVLKNKSFFVGKDYLFRKF